MRIEMNATEEAAHVLLALLLESPDLKMHVHNQKDIGVLGFEARDIQKASGLSTKQVNSAVEFLLKAGALEDRFPGHTEPGFVFRYVLVTDFGGFLYREYKAALEPQDLTILKVLQKIQKRQEGLVDIIDRLEKDRDPTSARHRLQRWIERTTELFQRNLNEAEVRRLSAIPLRGRVEDDLREYLYYMPIVLEDIRRHPEEMIPRLDLTTTSDTVEVSTGSRPKDQDSSTTETKPSDPRKVFVVCGRNKKANEALFSFLTSLGLDPQEWEEWVQATGHGSPYIGDVLKKGFEEAQAFVVFMTPDDEARLREPIREQVEEQYEISLTPQPRPNVIFEAGMAMSIDERRTILVELGKLRPISDIFGRYLVRIDNTREKRRELARRLESAECPVDLAANEEWLRAGDFDAALRVFDTERNLASLPAPARSTGPHVELHLSYKRDFLVSTGERHAYALIVEIENVGSVAFKDYRVDILFPKVFLDIESWGAEIREAETRTHKLIRRIAANFSQFPNGLFPGDRLTDNLIKYSVNTERYYSSMTGTIDVMQLPVDVSFVADGMAPQRLRKLIRELQEF